MGQATPSDFPSPQPVGPPQSRWLRTLHEGLARDFAAVLSALLRTPVDVRLAGVDERTYGQFLDRLDTPACFYVLKAATLEERLLLDIEPAILYPMIDRLLGGGRNGGNGDWSTSPERPPGRSTQIEPVPFSGRPLSQIEVRLAARIVRLFLAELRRAWKEVFDLKLDLLQVESNPRLLRVLPSDESVLLVGFELAVGPLRGMLRLCLPCRALERIGENGDWSNLPARPTGCFAQMEPVPSASLELTVTLAETQVPADELADLRPGDIIPTEIAADSPAVVLVEGSAQKFHARPGVYRGRKAICITAPFDSPAPSPPDQPPCEENGEEKARDKSEG